jgi:HEAT repeat protein
MLPSGIDRATSTPGAEVKLGSYSGFEIDLLRVAQWVGTAALAFALLLVPVVLLLRAQLLMRERRRRKFLTVWQPILMNAIEVASADVPQLAGRDLSNFLLLWNHLHESLLDESKDHLNQIAYALSIDRAALKMLRRGNLRKRLLAIVTLGQLRVRDAWDELSRITQHADAVSSVAAARALVFINPEEAIPQLIPLLTSRSDWTAARVAGVFQAAGADIISEPIARAAITFSREDTTKRAGRPEPINQAARLVRYLQLTHNNSALTAARTIAKSSRDPEILAACLQLLNSSDDLEVIRACLKHEAWPVRVQAAAALGRVGEPEDERRLIPLLSDKQWWVRYRAAQALSRLPSMRVPRLKAIQAKQPDRFARDMLAQVMAEIELQ